MKYIIPFIFFLSTLACNNNVDTPEESNESSYTVQTTVTHREYLRYGETEPFMNEYGRVVRYMNNDTTIQEYCKDSTSTFHRPTNKMIYNQKLVCYPQREVFINHIFKINENVLPSQKVYRRNYPKGSFRINDNGENYQVFRLMSILSKDVEGDTVLMHSNEYWNEELGLILKMDENFGRKRRRIIQLVNAQNPDKTEPNLSPIMDRIYQDSTEWITKNENGKARF